MKIPILSLLISIFYITTLFSEFETSVRDITYIRGIKKNILNGYGLVVGLEGTGDSSAELTKKTIGQYLEHNGLKFDTAQLKTQNVAIVAVTVELDGFLEKGDLVDLNVASIGDAKNIENGLLLQTVLRGGNGEIFAVGSGVITSGTGEVTSPRRGVVPGGGIVERSAGTESDYLNSKMEVRLVLKNPSLPALVAIENAILENVPEITPVLSDYKQVILSASGGGKLNYKDVAAVLSLKISLTSKAKVIIDKKSGIVVAGDQVRIDSAFISMPGISVNIEGGEKNLSSVIRGNATISDLASEFNQLGVAPKDMISIFSALSKCGAINAEIVIQ